MLSQSTGSCQLARFELALTAMLGIAFVSTIAVAEIREWNFSLEGELIMFDDDMVMLKTKNGKSIAIPRSQMSADDIAFLTKKNGEADSKDSQATVTASESADAPLDEEAKKKQEAKVRFAATRFFNALKKNDEEREEEVREVISAGAKEKLAGSGSEIKNLPKPDRSAKAAVRTVNIVGDRAEAVVRLRFKGKSITPTLMLRMEDGKWLAYGITGPNEEDTIETILFEEESEELEQGSLGETDTDDVAASVNGEAR